MEYFIMAFWTTLGILGASCAIGFVLLATHLVWSKIQEWIFVWEKLHRK